MTVPSSRDPRIDRHDVLLEKLVEQQIRFEEMLKVQIKRADAQEDALKEKNKGDSEKELELAKTLATIGQSMTIIKWAAAIIGGTLILDVMQHILPK